MVLADAKIKRIGDVDGKKATAVVLVDEDGSAIDLPVIVDDLEGGGKVAVGTTAVEVTFASATKGIIITADKDNTGDLYIGKSDVDSSGNNAITFLEAGDHFEGDYNDDTNALYVVASVASQNFWKGAAL